MHNRPRAVGGDEFMAKLTPVSVETSSNQPTSASSPKSRNSTLSVSSTSGFQKPQLSRASSVPASSLSSALATSRVHSNSSSSSSTNSATPVASSGCVPVTIVDNHDGTYTGTYCLPEDAAGRYLLSVTIQGEHIQGSPFQVHVDTANLSWDAAYCSDGSNASDYFTFADSSLSALKHNDSVYIQTIRTNKPLPAGTVKWRFRIDCVGQVSCSSFRYFF